MRVHRRQHNRFPATLTFACHGIVEGLHMFEKNVGGLAKCICILDQC